MEQRLVKISDAQLAVLIDHRKGADPNYDEIQFAIFLALKELEAYRATGFTVEQMQDVARVRDRIHERRGE